MTHGGGTETLAFVGKSTVGAKMEPEPVFRSLLARFPGQPAASFASSRLPPLAVASHNWRRDNAMKG